MSTGAGGADGAAAWQGTGDAILRGLAHQLSNRVGTLAAVGEALAAADPGGRLTAAVASEVRQLEEVLRLLRLVPGDPGRGAEPVRPADVLADVAALFAHHAAAHGVTLAIEGAAEAPPVRVHPPSLVRALLILLADAATAGGALAIRCDESGAMLHVTVGGPGDELENAATEDAARAAGAFVAGDAGTVTVAREAGGWHFLLRLPTLAELRRAEQGA